VEISGSFTMTHTTALKRLPDTCDEVFDDVREKGYHRFSRPLSPSAAAQLHASVQSVRRFDETLFLTEEAFLADPVYRGVNPRPGRNLLDRFEDQLGFVEQDPQIMSALSRLLGEDYRILDRKLVCGVPEEVVPEWLRSRIIGNPVNNLGPYVRPENRDVTYFFGIDYHQDLIDFPDRDADMITLYVYLHEVTERDAPLHVLEGSHQLGGTLFPHDLERLDSHTWRYRAGDRGAMDCHQIKLVGETGFAALWHGCTLHGTQPDKADKARLSLRYLISRSERAARCGVDDLNADIGWPVRLPSTRLDLDDDGRARMKRNAVNEA